MAGLNDKLVPVLLREIERLKEEPKPREFEYTKADLSGKIAVVTGSNKGLGKEIARLLISRGCTVLMGGRSMEPLKKAAAELGGTPLLLDINDSASIKAAIETVTKDHGRVDILVNNAGACFDANGDFTATNAETVTRDTLLKSFDVNLFRQIEVIQGFLPLLKAAPYANVVNITSIVGSIAVQSLPEGGVGHVLGYAASKAAFNMATVCFTHALQGTKVRMNNAHPGWLKTEAGGGDTGSEYQMEVIAGAETPVYLASLGPNSDLNGAFMGPTDVKATHGKLLDW